MRWDFVVERGASPRVLVEAKRRLKTDSRWAALARADLLDGMEDARESGQRAPMILVTPEWVYVWTGGEPPDSAPTAALDAEAILGPYLQKIGATSHRIDPMTFEDLIGWWLHQLADGVAEAVDAFRLSPVNLIGGVVRREAAA